MPTAKEFRGAALTSSGVLKRRHAHAKVYRPTGTKWAEAKCSDLSFAIEAAREEFEAAHGYVPPQHETEMEVIGVTARWVVVVLHIPD